MRRLVRTVIAFVVMLLTAAPAGAQDDATELSKQTQNPVADLISVPLQNNWFGNAGPKERSVYNLNIQPVIPVRLTDEWNVITRVIIPIINLPSLAPRVDAATGLGDINPTFFLSPAKPGALIWGVGPTFTLPTATDGLLGSSKWSAGPAAVALTMQGPWVVGALANQQWSFAGSGHNVSQLLIQPIINYNLGHGFAFISSPIITADWEAEDKNRWTVPVGAGVSQLFKIDKLPVKAALAGYYNMARPNFAPDWQLQLTLTFLFPQGRKP